MFGRNNKEQNNRRHIQSMAEHSFDMASYRRGTTLNSFKGEELTQSERRKLKKLKSLRRRIAAVLSVLIVLIALGVALLCQYTGRIDSVAITDGLNLSQEDRDYYVNIVNEYLTKNSFERLSFARRSSVLLQYVTDQAPEVADIRLVPNGLAGGKIELTLRRSVAMWINGEKIDFVDSNGVVFSKNFYDIPELAIEDNSGVTLDSGVATSAIFLSFIGRTATALEQAELKAVRVVIPPGSIRYVEFYLEGRDYPFKAQITRDSASQAHDILIITKYLDDNDIVPQYVDCRVEGRAYWK